MGGNGLLRDANKYENATLKKDIIIKEKVRRGLEGSYGGINARMKGTVKELGMDLFFKYSLNLMGRGGRILS
jgi:hypothetical protein